MMTRAAGRAENRLRLHHIVLISLISTCFLLDGVAHSMMGPLAPTISQVFKIGTKQLGPIFSANLVGQLVGMALIPMLQGRLGHQRIVVFSTIFYGVFEVATAFATAQPELLFMRFLTGVGLGGVLPSCLALVSERTPAARRGVAIMALFVGYGFGMMLSGAMVRLLAGGGHWQYPLVAAGSLSLICAAAIWFLLPKQDDAIQPHTLSQEGHDAASVRGESAPWRLFTPDMLFGTLMLWLVNMSGMVVNYCLTSWMPTMLLDIGVSKATAEFSVAAFAFGGVLSTVFVGPMIDRFGTTRTLSIFFCMAAILLFVAGRLLNGTDETVLMAVIAVAGFFLLGGYGGSNVMLTQFYPPALRAIGAGWTKSVSRIGTFLPPILIGFALARGVTENQIVSILAIPSALGAVGTILVGVARSRQHRAGTIADASGSHSRVESVVQL